MKFKSFLLLFSLFLVLLFLSGCTFTQYIAHYANQYGWRTKLTIQNSGSADVNITINCYDNDGNKISTATLTIDGYSFKTDYVDNFFTDTIPETGSLEIISDEPSFISKISTITLFEHSDSKGQVCMAGLQGTPLPSKHLTFPWFENSSNFTTGIAIVNVSDHDMVATMRAFKGDGTYVYSKPIKLAPYERIIGFASDFFTESIPDMSTLDVYGTGKMAGFIIMYNGDQTKAEAINGVVLSNKDTTLYSFNSYYDYSTFSTHLTHIVISRDYNKLFVYVKNDGIYEFDTADLNTGTKIYSASGNMWGEMALSPDGSRLVFTDEYSNKIYEINLKTHISSVIDDFTNVRSLAFSNDGNYFAAGTNSGNIELYEYDVSSQTYNPLIVFSESGGNILDMVFSPSSKYLVAIDYALNKLYYINLEAKTPVLSEKDLNLNNPTDIDVTDDGEYYICGEDDKLCYLSNLSQNPSYISLSSVTGLWHITLSPDGRYLFGAHGSNYILKVDLLYNYEETVISTDENVDDLVFSPYEYVLYFSGKKIGVSYY